MKEATAEMLAPVRESIRKCLLDLQEWGVAVRLHEALDDLVPGVRYETVAETRRVMADKLLAVVGVGYSDLADKLRRVVYSLTRVLRDLDD